MGQVGHCAVPNLKTTAKTHKFLVSFSGNLDQRNEQHRDLINKCHLLKMESRQKDKDLQDAGHQLRAISEAYSKSELKVKVSFKFLIWAPYLHFHAHGVNKSKKKKRIVQWSLFPLCFVVVCNGRNLFHRNKRTRTEVCTNQSIRCRWLWRNFGGGISSWTPFFSTRWERLFNFWKGYLVPLFHCWYWVLHCWYWIGFLQDKELNSASNQITEMIEKLKKLDCQFREVTKKEVAAQKNLLDWKGKYAESRNEIEQLKGVYDMNQE